MISIVCSAVVPRSHHKALCAMDAQNRRFSYNLVLFYFFKLCCSPPGLLGILDALPRRSPEHSVSWVHWIFIQLRSSFLFGTLFYLSLLITYSFFGQFMIGYDEAYGKQVQIESLNASGLLDYLLLCFPISLLSSLSESINGL
jgi:hypothetical protein